MAVRAIQLHVRSMFELLVYVGERSVHARNVPVQFRLESRHSRLQSNSTTIQIRAKCFYCVA